MRAALTTVLTSMKTGFPLGRKFVSIISMKTTFNDSYLVLPSDARKATVTIGSSLNPDRRSTSALHHPQYLLSVVSQNHKADPSRNFQKNEHQPQRICSIPKSIYQH